MENTENIERYRRGLQKISLEMFELDSKLSQIESSNLPETNKKYAKENIEENIKRLKVMSKKIEEALEKMYEEERENYKKETEEMSDVYKQESIDRRLEKYEAINTFLHNNPELVTETKGMSMEEIYKTYSDDIKQIMLDSRYDNNSDAEPVEETTNEEQENEESEMTPPTFDYDNEKGGEEEEDSNKNEIDNFLNEFNNLTPETPVVEEESTSTKESAVKSEADAIDVSVEVESDFDKHELMTRKNLEECNEAELNYIRSTQSVPENEELTEEHLKMCKYGISNGEFSPEKPKVVTAIMNKAKELTDKIKNNKGKVALAAIGGAALIIATGGTGLAFAPIGSVITAAGTAPILASTVALDGVVENHIENAPVRKQ